MVSVQAIALKLQQDYTNICLLYKGDWKFFAEKSHQIPKQGVILIQLGKLDLILTHIL